MKIPCKNCITYPICKSQLGKEFFYLRIVTVLYQKCSLLRELVKDDTNGYTYDPCKVSSVIRFFLTGVYEPWDRNSEWKYLKNIKEINYL